MHRHVQSGFTFDTPASDKDAKQLLPSRHVVKKFLQSESAKQS
jgi:hypothetical protein